jgi:RNA polymerase sigma-B factor
MSQPTRTDHDAGMERFREYRRTGDRELRNELMAEHTRLAEALARRMMHRGEPLEDLSQVAMVGLLKAVERFDPDHGVRFSSFATPTILGELKRHFRDRGWAVRVPRRVQELHLAVRDATTVLHQELGRPPTTGELADRLAVREEDVIESMEAGTLYRLTSLDADPGGQPERATGERDPHLDAVDDRVTVERLLAMLPDREQRIMRMRFYEGRTQGEIAARVGVSQMQVSRLIARSIETLGAHARRSLGPVRASR